MSDSRQGGPSPHPFTLPRSCPPRPLAAPAARGDFLPSDFWGAPSAPASCATLAVSLPPFDPWALPLASTRHPKLESNFPHHIPQKLLRGEAGSSATHEGSRTRERRNIFIFSLPLSCLCCVLRILLPLHPDAAQSKTISEHIAQVRLRSLSRFQLPFLSPDFARFSSFSFSCRARPPLCRPAYSTLVEDVITRVPLLFPYFPSLSCFAVLAALLFVFHRARSSSEQEASEEAR